MIFLSNESDFNLNKEKVCVFFYNKNQPFCDIAMSSIAELDGNITIYIVDIINFKNMITRFNLVSTPTFILFKDKRERRRFHQIQLLEKNIKEVFYV